MAENAIQEWFLKRRGIIAAVVTAAGAFLAAFGVDSTGICG